MKKGTNKLTNPGKEKWSAELISDRYFTDELFLPADKEHIKRERHKAKELKKTLWWKNKLSKGECYFCGKQFNIENLSMDHLVPLVRRGRTIKNNVVVACKKCNSEKKHKTSIEIHLNK